MGVPRRPVVAGSDSSVYVAPMIATMLLLWACSGSDPSDDSPGRPTSGTGLPYVFPTGLRPTGETGTAAVPGQIAIDVGDQTAAGGHLWVMAFVEHLPIEARLDGFFCSGHKTLNQGMNIYLIHRFGLTEKLAISAHIQSNIRC